MPSRGGNGFRHIGHIDIASGGQIIVQNEYACVGTLARRRLLTRAEPWTQ